MKIKGKKQKIIGWVFLFFFPLMILAEKQHGAVFLKMNEIKEENDHFLLEIIYVKQADSRLTHDDKNITINDLKTKFGLKSDRNIEGLANFKDPVYFKRTIIIIKKGTFLAAFADENIPDSANIENYDFCLSGSLSVREPKNVFVLKYSCFMEQKKVLRVVNAKQIEALKRYEISGELSLELGVSTFLGTISSE